MRNGGFILAFHGCDRTVGESLLAGADFKPSENGYDWLGDGVYFWENNPTRALEWAKFMAAHPVFKQRVKEPFAVGAVISPGNCLDLTEAHSLSVVRAGYEGYLEAFNKSGTGVLPRNEAVNDGDEDLIRRKLDCAVINYVHSSLREAKRLPYDTVRGAFPEGNDLYPGARIKEKTHIQIAVCNPENIIGVFRVKDSLYRD